jgi:putative ABC transport system permease protein
VPRPFRRRAVELLQSARRNAHIGAGALRAHRLRSALTTLGVVFGVAAVVCMLAIGKGAERRVLAELQRLGVRNLHVQARPPKDSAPSTLATHDAAALAGELRPFVDGVAAERGADRRVHYAGQSTPARFSGVTASYARYLDLEVQAGRFISDLDVATGAAVCVASEPLAMALSPPTLGVGDLVRCGGMALRVVGVARGLGLGEAERPPLFVPITLAQALLPRAGDPRAVERIVLRVTPRTEPAALAPVIEAALLRRHTGVRDFEVVVPRELLRREQRAQRVFQFVMGGIAGISLLVGGIGIANILFASVVERTPEIGVRRAVGATRRDVVLQFLFEALAIGAAGGVAGVLLGIAAAVVVARAADWPVLVTPGSIIISTVTALVTGLVSGSAPALQAARVDAIVALHHE